MRARNCAAVGARGAASPRRVAAGASGAYVKSMADTLSSSSRPTLRPLLLGAGLVGALLAATLALWAHYGSAVFFEMIRAGLAACF